MTAALRLVLWGPIALVCTAMAVGRAPLSAGTPAAGVLRVELGVHVEPSGLVNGRIVSGNASDDNEDAHRGRSADTLPIERWIEAMGRQLTRIRALGVARVRATLDPWLRDQIAPLLRAGRARWAACSQMADAYLGGP